MPKHSDFEKIYHAFMWRYCQDHKECDTGRAYEYGWLKNTGLDDTKPYQRPQEKFSWTEPYIKYLKEDELAKYFKVEALFPLSSMNNNVYTAEELMQATRTLIGKPVNWNHTLELAKDVSIYDAQYEEDCAECLLRALKGSQDLERIEKETVAHVSIECECLRGSEWTPDGTTCKGLVYVGRALLSKEVLPGVPLTRIMPVEKLVESFKGIAMENEEKQRKAENSDGDYEILEKIDDLQSKYEALKSELEQLKKPKEEPKQPNKEPGKCLLTKEGFWARFHQLRREGMDKSDAFRIVSQEVIAAATKKSQ